MKKCSLWIILLFIFSGCSGTPDELQTGMELRSRVLQASGCTFDAEIKADYGDEIHTFSMECSVDSKGMLNYKVTGPETISGITGTVSGDGGKLTFDETALCFPLMADGQASPISAPWILMQMLRTGYIASACKEEGKIRLSIDDNLDEKPLRVDLWLNMEELPVHADILYDGRRILSVSVDNFRLL